jgi:outer membrane protein insertion porin family
MQKIFPKFIFLLVIIMLTLLSACGVKKSIPKGEYLFRGGKVVVYDTLKINPKPHLENELQDLLYPKPNTRILGIYIGLYYHYKAQKENAGFITRFLNKKIGEEPVYYSDAQVESTKELIANRLNNSGYFQNEIALTIRKDTTKRSVKTNYKVYIGKPYELSRYTVEDDSLDKANSFPIYDEIRNSLGETILKSGNRYDLDAFKEERNRIDFYLKKRGYYNFNSNFILFQADTNLNDHRHFNLYLKLKNGVPNKSKVPYIINKINVYPNVTQDTSGLQQSTITLDEKSFIQNEVFFKPKRLQPFILLKPNQTYDPLKSKYTSQRISSIGTYKFVNINYTEVDTTKSDSLKVRYLDADISLSPMTKRSIRAELQGVTKSNNFTGPNIGVTYINRNVFKGGENFSANGNFGYEKQFGNNTNGSSSLQMGFNISLTFPRLIFPGNVSKIFKYSIPKTKVSLGTEYLRRSKLYTLEAYSASFGYFWKANRFVSHEVDLIKINYLQLNNKSDLFNSILDDNPFLKRSFEQQFIAGLTYSFIYNELNNQTKKGRFNIKFNIDIAGNMLGLLTKNQSSDTTKSFLGIAYAQYAKADIDLSYHYDIDKAGNTLIGRFFGGIGIPYGNSQTMPYIKQYYSGGSYSVRAFQIRSLGPGTYAQQNNNNLLFDRSGDIRLEGNLEYRFPVISIFKGAVFADAGNIWNLNNNLIGGEFTSDFIKQFGVGAGIGLRVDVQGFVIRFDLATPLKSPLTAWNFAYKSPVFNFAIGYPF